MKEKFKLLGIILTIAVIGIFSACDPSGGTVNCPDVDNDGNGHLGIGEDCIRTADGTACTGLQDYRTTDMKTAGHADYFQWPIYRVGAESHYGINGVDVTNTVPNILAGYKIVKGLGGGIFDNLISVGRLSEVHVTYSLPVGKTYTWKNKQLGVLKLTSVDLMVDHLSDIGDEGLQEVTPIVQLQPASNIRMALGARRVSPLHLTL